MGILLGLGISIGSSVYAASEKGVDPFSLQPSRIEDLSPENQNYIRAYYNGEVRTPGTSPGAAMFARYYSSDKPQYEMKRVGPKRKWRRVHVR